MNDITIKNNFGEDLYIEMKYFNKMKIDDKEHSLGKDIIKYGETLIFNSPYLIMDL